MRSRRSISQIGPVRAESCDTASLIGSSGRLPSLEIFLDEDSRPSFLVPINEIGPVPFQLLFCNDAFKRENLEDEALRECDESRHFRAWTQVVRHWRTEYEFAGRLWTAFTIKGQWKCVQSSGAVKAASPEDDSYFDLPMSTLKALEDIKVADARIASMYRMMEMSEVGTFEYSPQGRLLRANESWYRLSSHPAAETVQADFTFMDMVYPPDCPLVLSQWNKLAQGHPVTFEMRWKSKNYENLKGHGGSDESQWVLSACIPIQDEHGNLVSIAGNTVDINAQKIVQEEALQRAEALERARESERKFSRFALLAPIAIYICDAEGRMTYCNNRFFELTGHPVVDDFSKIDWDAVVFPEDQATADKQWSKLVDKKQRTQAHYRLRQTWGLGDGALRQVWIESQAFPELDDDGNVVSIFGTMTNISRFKWAEEIQKSRMQEALDAKHKHENFIDMTSHEMRNPLSAVIQCADSTIDSLKVLLSHAVRTQQPDTLQERIANEIKACMDSQNTIISCSIHQKRVIDDVLTLSKMDSNLLAIAPVIAEPASIVAEAVHMFELECQKENIELSFSEDPSLREAGAHFVMMDPSRVLQVLINFLTNAIKFTRDRPTRRIEVSLGASTSRPSDQTNGIPYASVITDSTGLLDNEEWGSGREVYISIHCRDTGCGMTVAEQGNLFTRFSQATPRTHIRYGGSGLGLFISKKLTELQGGAIGVQSQPEVGSTFAFFVATRTAPPPMTASSPDASDYSNMNQVMSTEGRITVEHGLEKAAEYSILIVEDNLVNQKVLSQQLRKAGCQVYVANHGREALDFLQKTTYWADSPSSRATTSSSSNTTSPPPQGSAPPTPPQSSEQTPQLQSLLVTATPPPIKLSVVLMDIEMPVMDGLSCTRHIRQLQREGRIVGHVPIMAVSANARSEQVIQAREAGMDDTISKPFRIPELMPKIEALVHGEGPVMVLPSSTNFA